MGGPVLPAVAGVGAGNVGAGNVADVPGGIDQPRRSGAAKGARYTIAKFCKFWRARSRLYQNEIRRAPS